MRPKKTTNELSACETLVMKVVWDAKDDLPVQDLIVRMRERFNKDYARTTVVTFLGKIAQKGYVSTYRVGKMSYVHPEMEEKTYKKKLIEEQADFWFEGKPSELLKTLCESRKVPAEEIQKMRKLLDKMER